VKLSDKEFYEQSGRKFFMSLGRKAGKVAKYAMLIRFAITLLMAKFNLLKAVKSIKPVILLGLGCGSFNVIHHCIRRFFALKRLASPAYLQSSFWLSQENELIWACGLGSLGLHIAPANDIRILKIVMFSRAVSSLVKYIGDATGWFKPVENNEKRKITVEYVLAVLGCWFLIYCYIFQANTMSKSLKNTFHRGLHLNDNEKRLFDCMRAIDELESR